MRCKVTPLRIKASILLRLVDRKFLRCGISVRVSLTEVSMCRLCSASFRGVLRISGSPGFKLVLASLTTTKM